MTFMVVNHAPTNHLHGLEFLEHDWFAALRANTAGHMINLFTICQRGTSRLWKFTLFRHYLNPFRLVSVCLSTWTVRAYLIIRTAYARIDLRCSIPQRNGTVQLKKRFDGAIYSPLPGWYKHKREPENLAPQMIHLLQKFATNTALQGCTTRRTTAKTTSICPNVL